MGLSSSWGWTRDGFLPLLFTNNTTTTTTTITHHQLATKSFRESDQVRGAVAGMSSKMKSIRSTPPKTEDDPRKARRKRGGKSAAADDDSTLDSHGGAFLLATTATATPYVFLNTHDPTRQLVTIYHPPPTVLPTATHQGALPATTAPSTAPNRKSRGSVPVRANRTDRTDREGPEEMATAMAGRAQGAVEAVEVGAGAGAGAAA